MNQQDQRKVLTYLVQNGLDNELSKFLSFISYKSFEIDKEKAYNTYKTRSLLHLNDKNLSGQFSTLLEKIEKAKESEIKIHMLGTVECAVFVFSTIDCNEVLGYLFFSGNDNSEIDG